MNRRRAFFLVAVATVSLAVSPPAARVLGQLPPERLGGAAADSVVGEGNLPFGAATSYLIGTTLLEQGDFEAALPYLHHAYRLDPAPTEIASSYLTALLGLGFGPEALRVLDGLIAAEPGDPEHRRRKIALLTDLRRFDEALAELGDLRRSAQDPVQMAIVEAEILARRGDGAGAVAALRRLLEHPAADREEVYLQLAALLKQTGRAAELTSLWEEAVRELPASQPLRFQLLRQLVKEGRIAEAHRVAEQGRPAAPPAPGQGDPGVEPVDWEYELVDQLVENEYFTEAIAVLEGRRGQDTLDLDPGLLLARLLVRSGREGEALRLLRETISRWPESGWAHFHLGDLLAATGDLSGAEPELRRAVELGPEQPDFLVSLVRFLTVRHRESLTAARPDSAADASRREIGRLALRASVFLPETDHRGHLILGFSFAALADYVRAEEHFAAAAAGKATRKDALLQLAISQEDSGQRPAAEQSLQTLWEEFPGDPVVANSLGYFLAERGADLDRAERLVRQALDADPENGAYIDSLGWVFFKQGNFQAAFDQLVRAANAIPDDATILEHLGLTLRALGQVDEALRVLRRAVDLGADEADLSAVIEELEKAGQ